MSDEHLTLAARLKKHRLRLEARLIRRALAENRTVLAAARSLRVNRSNLYERMRKLGIESPRSVANKAKGHAPQVRRVGPQVRSYRAPSHE